MHDFQKKFSAVKNINRLKENVNFGLRTQKNNRL